MPWTLRPETLIKQNFDLICFNTTSITPIGCTYVCYLTSSFTHTLWDIVFVRCVTGLLGSYTKEPRKNAFKNQEDLQINFHIISYKLTMIHTIEIA